MKRKSTFLILIVVSVLMISPAWRAPQDKDYPATITKVVRDVTKKGQSTGWQKAMQWEQLRAGYELKTDKASFAMIKFSDETKIIVRENSIVEVKARRGDGKQVLDRSVYSRQGSIGFDVKKQEKEQFSFSSPISVASIRGTKGGYIAGVDSTDQLIINEGLATLTNLLSHLSQDVSTGQIGITYGNGQINVQKSTPDQQQQGNVGYTGQGGGNQQGQGGGQKVKRVLRIPREDKDRNMKTIIFEWEE